MKVIAADLYAVYVVTMAQRPRVRDYLYVSRTRVERLAASLPPKAFARLKEANLKIGPVGGGVSLAPPEKRLLVEAIADVEPAIRKDHRIRDINERPLEPGMWVESSFLKMAYGTPAGYATTLEAALFTSVDLNTRVLLAGSSSGLLDRTFPTPEDPAGSMSDPQSILRLLRSVRPNAPDTPVTPVEEWQLHGYPIASLHRTLEWNSGLHPVTFLAVVIQTSVGDSWTNIIAQPLYVALAPPD